MVADWLKPIYQCIRTGVMAGGYVQAYETPVRYLAPENGKTKTGYFWTTSRPGGDAVYQWEISRAATCLDNVLPVDFKGTVKCNGYAAYASFARHKEHIQLAACWAHARRKFYEAREQDPLIAGWLLHQIGHLYRLERKLRDNRSGPQLRAAVRAHQARPVYQRLHRVLSRLKIKRRYLPRSRMGLAIEYALNLWSLLGVYLNDGRLEIDQNLVENAIRPFATRVNGAFPIPRRPSDSRNQPPRGADGAGQSHSAHAQRQLHRERSPDVNDRRACLKAAAVAYFD